MFKCFNIFNSVTFRSLGGLLCGLSLGVWILGLIGYAPSALAQVAEVETPVAYQQAVEDAATVDPEETFASLTPIRPDNTNLVWNEDGSRVLVVTWKSQGSYERFLKPYTYTSDHENYVVWVTAVPEVRSFCHGYLLDHMDAGSADLDLRLKQHLGLGADWQYDVFVEMWVSPEDLFRPCVDPEITDTQCQLSFGPEIPQVKNISDYASFYKNLYYGSFRQGPGVPWTGLGYTYDWGNPAQEIGASEFILVPGAEYEIHRVMSTAQYCWCQDMES